MASKGHRAGAAPDLAALRLFARVARLGSFSAAAREAGLSQPQVSRTIAGLEADLRAVLLTRTTRAVVLTDAGSTFLGRIEPIIGALDEAVGDLTERQGFRGQLRLSMPASIGARIVIPALRRFAEAHPDLRIEAQFDDHWQDLIRDAVDVAIRVGRLPENGIAARQIARIRRVVVAAPAYLAAAGVPGEPDDLRRHRIVGGPAAAVPNAWRFERLGQTTAVELTPIFWANDNVGAVAAAEEGWGVTSTSRWSCQREIDEGRLVELLADWSLAPIPVHACFPMGKATRRVARAAVAEIEAFLADGAR